MQIKRIFKIKFFNDCLTKYKGIKLVKNEITGEPIHIIGRVDDNDAGMMPKYIIIHINKKYKFEGGAYYDYDIAEYDDYAEYDAL